MTKLIKKLKKVDIILILILVLASFLRFYRLAEMANFDFDQEYASNFAYTIIKDYPIQLIGQGLSVEGLFLGPLYFYYLVPFFAIFNLHPLGGFVGSVIVGLVTILAYYLLARELFGKNAGLIAAFLRSIIYVSLNNDWNMAPAYAAELVVLATWWCFYRYWRGQTKYLPHLAFLFGLYTSIHPILFPFYFVFIALFVIKRSFPKIKTIGVSLIAFVIPLSPLLVFEYLHDFWEVKKLLAFFIGPSMESPGLARLTSYSDFVFAEAYNILQVPFLSNQVFLILLSILFILLSFKKVSFFKQNFHKIALPLTFIIFLAYYTFFPTHVPEYYFLALSSLTLLYISVILAILSKNPISIIILFIILANITWFNLNQLIEKKWTNPSQITLYHKDSIVKEIVKRQSDKEEFFVSYISALGWNFGFNYLFKLYGEIPQTREAKQPIYTIVMPKSLSPDSINISSGNIGVILPD